MAILLNPGPVVLSDAVRQALLQEDLCHREVEFIALQQGIRSHLLAVYQLPPEQWGTILLTGSGSAAVEAMLISLVPQDGKVLILENGIYGARLAYIAQCYGINHVIQKHEWTQGIDLSQLRQRLEQHPDISHLAVVHHETTTGRLNDLSQIAALCEAHQVDLLIDAVSSFAGEDIAFEQFPIAACAATANKCIHGVPGASFVIVNRPKIEKHKTVARSLYLDLHHHLQKQDANDTAFTQSVQAFYALEAALIELHNQGGWRARHADYCQRMNMIREHFKQDRITEYISAEESACMLASFHLPQDITYTALHDQLKCAGFIIYAGQGKLHEHIFRVACMGHLSLADIEDFTHHVSQIIRAALVVRIRKCEA